MQRKLVITIIALTLGTLGAMTLIGVGLGTLYRTWQFCGKVDRVSGTIDRLEIGQGRHSSYLVTYHYHDANGGAHMAVRVQMGRDTWRQLHEGGQVPIKYLPNSSDVSRVDLVTEDDRAWKNSLMGIIIGGAFLGLVWWSCLRTQKPRQYTTFQEVIGRMKSGWKNRRHS